MIGMASSEIVILKSSKSYIINLTFCIYRGFESPKINPKFTGHFVISKTQKW